MPKNGKAKGVGGKKKVVECDSSEGLPQFYLRSDFELF